MRSSPIWLLLLALGACSSCDEDEVVEAPATTEPRPEPEPEPVDPCPDADAELEAFLGAEPVVALEAIPSGRGGVPLAEPLTMRVAEEVHLGERSLGAPDAAAEALGDEALPEGEARDQPIALILRASDPVSRIAPLLRAFPTEQQFGLVVIETDREHAECRSVRQLIFGLWQGDEHGWVTFPTARPVSDLVVALGGADTPRRVQLLD